MKHEEIMTRLGAIFHDVFDDDKIVLTRATMADDIPEWDSLAHVRLIVAVEKAFGVRFDVKEINEMPNVGVMADIVGRKLGASVGT